MVSSVFLSCHFGVENLFLCNPTLSSIGGQRKSELTLTQIFTQDFLHLGKFASNVQLSEFAIPFGGPHGIHEKFTTLPQALKEFNYATHLIGKFFSLIY